MSDVLRIAGIVLLLISQASCRQQSKCMQLNLAEGFQFEAKLAVKTRCLTDFADAGQQVGYRRDTGVEFSCQVLERRSDGNMRIEFKYTGVKDTCFFEREWDPPVPHAGQPDGLLRRGYGKNESDSNYHEKAIGALLGHSFIAQVGPEGVVREMEGLDELSRSLHDALAFRRPYKMGDSFRKEMEDRYEQDFQKFFGDYWPLSRDRVKETVQELFLIWPESAIDTGVSWHTRDVLPALALKRANFWTVKDKQADTGVVELVSDVHTDLSLCDPSIPEVDTWDKYDFLKETCRWCRQKVNPLPKYAGDRKGLFNVDLRSGLLRDARWTEELSGIVPFRWVDKEGTERMADPSKRTQSVSIQIIPQRDNGTSKASESHP